jgi:hypothetical protein
MFESSHPVLLFDEFRVPYATDRAGAARPHGQLKPVANDRALSWIVADGDGVLPGVLAPRRLQIGSIPAFGHVAPDSVAADLLSLSGGAWTPTVAVTDERGNRLSYVWRSDGGSVFLPFDPNELIRNFWSEAYLAASTRARLGTGARRAYYRVRPAIPRPVQIAARRAFSRVQQRVEFPRWPIEPALHDLYSWLLGLVTHVAQEPVPWIGHWPDGRSWALVLTHDVETADGYEMVREIRDLERDAGLRSSWNFVARRYAVGDDLVAELLDSGFEVGVHGLYHDGRDLDSKETLDARLPAIREARDRWGAAGFRAPALHRRWEWMSKLGFDYDSSYPDTDPYEPQSGGCCSWLPFFNGDTVELPVTLTQDHTLFTILRHSDEHLWLEKADFLRGRGGMALALTHPDYMEVGPVRDAYRRFMETFADDPTAWNPLPREAASWWRRRAGSVLEHVRGRWRVTGPASQAASISFSSMGLFQ